MMRKKGLVKHGASALTPWTPFREMGGFKDILEGAIEDFLGNGHGLRHDLMGGRDMVPAVDVEEKDKEYVFSLELPGLSKGDFKVELRGQTLTVSGERKEEKKEEKKNYLRHEQYYGSFSRSFSLPEDAVADAVKASYKDGILRIVIARSEAAKPKEIAVG